MRLAAIRYESGFRIDEFLESLRQRLRDDGLRLGGATQENAGTVADHCAAMTLVNIATGARIRISQDLGSQARGCRLDPYALAQFGALLDAAIDESVDLLILNKFGRAEADGHGLRGIFARAIEAGIPVLTAVRPPYVEAWTKFHEGLAADLAPDLERVRAWCHRNARRHGTARATRSPAPDVKAAGASSHGEQSTCGNS